MACWERAHQEKVKDGHGVSQRCYAGGSSEPPNRPHLGTSAVATASLKLLVIS